MGAPTNPTIGYLVLVVAAGLAFLVGILINVFIVAVNIMEWKKGRPVSTTNKVITSLVISRMFFLLKCLLSIISDIYSYRMSSMSFALLGFLEVASLYSGVSLSVLLSVVFCLKISTFHNVFFLRLKTFVLNRVYHLIMATVVGSASYGLAFCFLINFKYSLNTTHETYDKIYFGLWVSILIFITSVPFLVYFISSVLLVIYLYHHMSRLRSEMNRVNHLDTYYKTIKFTGFSLFCYIFYIIFGHTSAYLYNVFSYIGIYFIWEIITTLHSMYLIYVTTKLRSQFSNIVHQLKSRCCEQKSPTWTVSQ